MGAEGVDLADTSLKFVHFQTPCYDISLQSRLIRGELPSRSLAEASCTRDEL